MEKHVKRRNKSVGERLFRQQTKKDDADLNNKQPSPRSDSDEFYDPSVDNDREDGITRREFIKMAWTAPVVAAITLSVPTRRVYAQSSHLDYQDHGDYNDHLDSPYSDHNDGHSDVYVDTSHGDQHHDSHFDHTDGTHQDTPYQDSHSDSHTDHTDTFHTDSHGDSPHSDISSHDDHLDHIDSG